MKNKFKLGFVGILLVLALTIIPYVSAVQNLQTPYDVHPLNLYTYKVSIDNGLKISYDDWEIKFQPYFVMQNDQVYSWSDIPGSIDKNIWQTKTEWNNYKYGIDFNNVPQNIKDNLKYIVLQRVSTENLTWSDVIKEGNSLRIKNEIVLSHDDLLKDYSIFKVNKTSIVIGDIQGKNVTECFDFEQTNCTTTFKENFISNGDGTYNITFDPQITLDGEVSYNSTDSNITNRGTGFALINLSDNSIKAYWAMDSNVSQNIIYDYSNNDNHDGEIRNEASFNSSGKYGGAYQFDGANDFITVNDSSAWDISASTSNNFSISFWVRHDGSPSGAEGYIAQFADTSNYWLIRHNAADDGLRFNLVIGGTDMIDTFPGGTGIISDGDWHYIILNKQNSNYTLYLDTIAVSNTVDSSTGNLTAGLNIGTWDGASLGLDGAMDEIIFRNRSLNLTEINDSFNNQSSKFFPQGTMFFQDINVSETGNENILNITLQDYQHFLGTNISVALNNGSFFNLSNDGTIKFLNFTGDANFLNITFKFISDSNNFYTPLMIGNITLDSWEVVPPIPGERTLRFDWGAWMNDSLKPDKICFLLINSEFCFNQTFSTGQLWQSISGIVKLVFPSNVSIDGSLGIGVEPTHQFHIVLNETDNFFIDGSTNKRESTAGAFRQTQTPAITGTRLINLVIDTNNQADTSAIITEYKARGMRPGDTGAIHQVDVDTSNSLGGIIEGWHVEKSGTGLVDVHAIHAGTGVHPIHQDSGEFGNIEQAFIFDGSFTDVTASFNSTSSDVQMFVNNDDYVYIKKDTMFSEVEVLLSITASGAGVKPIFEYFNGSWTSFGPADGTNGFRLTGNIVWTASDLIGWTNNSVNSINGFWIRIQRTANSLTTPPTEDTIKYSLPIEYTWDPNGNLFINEMNMSGNLKVNDTFLVDIVNSQVNITGDLNVDGDINTTGNIEIDGNLNMDGNLSIGEKITFKFGEMIDNLVDGWLRVTGSLNVTENVEINGNLSVYGNVNITQNLSIGSGLIYHNGSAIIIQG